MIIEGVSNFKMKETFLSVLLVLNLFIYMYSFLILSTMYAFFHTCSISVILESVILETSSVVNN